MTISDNIIIMLYFETLLWTAADLSALLRHIPAANPVKVLYVWRLFASPAQGDAEAVHPSCKQPRSKTHITNLTLRLICFSHVKTFSKLARKTRLISDKQVSDMLESKVTVVNKLSEAKTTIEEGHSMMFRREHEQRLTHVLVICKMMLKL